MWDQTNQFLPRCSPLRRRLYTRPARKGEHLRCTQRARRNPHSRAGMARPRCNYGGPYEAQWRLNVRLCVCVCGGEAKVGVVYNVCCCRATISWFVSKTVTKAVQVGLKTNNAMKTKLKLIYTKLWAEAVECVNSYIFHTVWVIAQVTI